MPTPPTTYQIVTSVIGYQIVLFIVVRIGYSIGVALRERRDADKSA